MLADLVAPRRRRHHEVKSCEFPPLLGIVGPDLHDQVLAARIGDERLIQSGCRIGIDRSADTEAQTLSKKMICPQVFRRFPNVQEPLESDLLVLLHTPSHQVGEGKDFISAYILCSGATLKPTASPQKFRGA